MHAEAMEIDAVAMSRTRTRNIIKIIWKQKVLFLFMLPGTIALILFSYAPMMGLIMAFQDFKVQTGFFGSDFVGFQHFGEFFKDSDFYNALRNTLAISVLSIIFGFPAPIILALMLDNLKSMRIKKLVQTVTYMPHFITWVFIASLVYRLLDRDTGIVNMIVESLGSKPIAFMHHPEYFWGILIASSIWKEIGWGSIIYLAAIAGIDPELHSAAMVDGANRFQRTIYITLPCILPTIGLMFILTLGSLVTVNFEAVFNMMNPVVQLRADVIDTYVYRTGVQMAKYSYASAIGLTQAVIACILVFVGYKVTQKINGGFML